MTSILKVDTIQDADGNNIINESGNTITIGASGDTTNIIGTLQNDGAAVGAGYVRAVAVAEAAAAAGAASAAADVAIAGYLSVVAADVVIVSLLHEASLKKSISLIVRALWRVRAVESSALSKFQPPTTFGDPQNVKKNDA